MSLKAKLIKRILDAGPLSVGEYMAECTAHYYATRDPLGRQGDFTTSPEISQIFGELAGAWMVECWSNMGAPEGILCELGPGRGTLMKDLLRAARPQFRAAMDVRLVELSPTLRQLQKQALQDAKARISWHGSLDDLPKKPLFLVANEFFDALPVHQYLRAEGGWQERKVDYDGKRFVFTPKGKVTAESSPDSADFMAHIATHIRTYGGAALIIDYGYSGKKQGDSLQAVRRHAFVDPLQDPGEADLTAHVDFALLLHTAKGRGAKVWGAIPQGTFLKRLGAELRATALCRNASPAQQKEILSGLERIVAPHRMGTLFKVIAVTSSVDKPAGF